MEGSAMAQQMKMTLSVIKADVGSVAGHTRPHPDMMKKAEECLAAAKGKQLLIDFCVSRCGDDINLIMTHQHGLAHEPIHRLAWETFMECTKVPKRPHL